jgi:osmoprotectant transport system ATP-binding protein
MISPRAAAPARHGVDIEFVRASKRFGGQQQAAVSDLTFRIEAGQICCLVGPSGGGKTTTMKLVNRLIDLTDGDILIGGRSVRDTDPTELRRGIGYVIQEVGLFPHMTVADNIGVVPRLLGWSRIRIRQRTGELLELVNLLPPDVMARRYPAQLSGGQRQRVGLARALAVDPPLMLMDEPFGALDHITRSRVQDEFLRLHRELRKTVIFVTHDIDEAIKMGDRIAVLREGGVLAQYATPDELLAHPADDHVASLVGADRGLKRLALRRVGDLVRREARPPVPSSLPEVTPETTLRVALSVLLAAEAPGVSVRGPGGPVGTITLEELRTALSATTPAADAQVAGT